MDKIDRLGWTAGICFVAYGRRIGIRVNERESLAPLIDCLPPGCRPPSSPRVDRLYSILFGGKRPRSRARRFHLLYAGPKRLARTMDFDLIRENLESNLQHYVAEAARRRIFVHAGVVAWRRKAIVIPGRSSSGKTTLVTALLRRGATYYSDEYAVLDSRGRVHPYPVALSFRKKGGSSPERRMSAETLGSKTGSRPLSVGLVAVCHYKPGARWRPRRPSRGEAALALLSNTIVARWEPERALETLRPAVSQAVALKGARGEADEVADSLLAALDAHVSVRGEKAG